MCGNVGVAGNLSFASQKMFKDMLIFDQVRGTHSTGVFAIKNLQAEQILEKAVGTPSYLWDWGSSKIFDGDGDPKGYYHLLMGHNRAATSGKITVENAHPFEYDNLVGAHNGSLTHYSDLDGTADMIDSQRLYQHINNHGIDEAWKSFNGAAALVWYDKTDKTINFIRNKERPLYYVYSSDKKQLFWASELWMITISASRRNVNLEKNDKGSLVSHSFAENNHYKFNITTTNVELHEQRELEARTSTPFRYGYTGFYDQSAWDNWEDWYKRKHEEKKETSQTSQTATTLGPARITQSSQAQWSEGTERAEKQTRGLEFLIVGRGAKGTQYNYLIGSFIDDDEKVAKPYLEIIPRNQSEYEELAKYLYSERIFRTKARCRAAPDADGKINKLKISAQHVERTEMFFDEDKKEQSGAEVITLYRSFGNKRVTKEQFIEDLSKLEGGSTCYACGTDLDITQHENFMWLDKHMCVCPSCSSDRLVAAGMN